MQMGFYFDQMRCTGCFTCIVACKDWNDVDAGPASWRRVITIEKGKYPDLFVAFLSTACYHCIEPICVSACPVDAISKRELDGVVVVDGEACLGQNNCDMCLEACPYDALFLGHSFERAKYRRGDLVQTNDELLESPERPASGYFHPDIAKKLPRQTLLVDRIVEKS